MAQVVSLNGKTALQAKEPSQYLVDFLEEHLERARSGELQGLAVATHYHDGGAGWSVVGRVGGVGMIGALELCKAELFDINRDAQ